MVSSFGNAFLHTGDREVGIGQKEVMKPNLISRFLGSFEDRCIGPPAQRGLQGKCFLPGKRCTDFTEKDPGRLDGRGARSKWGETAGDLIGVQEAEALDLLRKKLTGEGGLARTIATSDQVDDWLFRRHDSCLARCPGSVIS